MTRNSNKKLVFVIALAIAMLASMGLGMALAADGVTIPHGGYDDGLGANPMTDACLQCHDVHEAAGEYVLMREPTVTGVCSTCHNIYVGSYRGGASPYDPGYPSVEASYASLDISSLAGATTSYSRVYETALSNATTHEGHRLGMAASIAAGSANTTYSDGVVTTNSNYIPGGSLELTRVVSWLTKRNAEVSLGVGAGSGEGLQAATASCDEADCTGYVDAPLPPGFVTGAAENGAPITDSSTSGLYCASCHSPHGEFGAVMPNSVYSGGTIVGNYFFSGGGSDEAKRTRGKLLSDRPNHDQTNLGNVSQALTSYVAEGGEWCGRCHDKRLTGADLEGVTHNNHPSSFCLDCHGVYVGALGAPTAVDFPHTADTGLGRNLLQKTPDELCLDCHADGYQP